MLHTTPLNDLNNVNTAIAPSNPDDLLRVILYGDKSFDKETNCKILTATIKFIKDTQPFEKSHFYSLQIIFELLQLISNIVGSFYYPFPFLMYFSVLALLFMSEQ